MPRSVVVALDLYVRTVLMEGGAQMHQTARWAAHLTQGPGSLAAGASHVIGLRAPLSILRRRDSHRITG